MAMDKSALRIGISSAFQCSCAVKALARLSSLLLQRQFGYFGLAKNLNRGGHSESPSEVGPSWDDNDAALRIPCWINSISDLAMKPQVRTLGVMKVIYGAPRLR